MFSYTIFRILEIASRNSAPLLLSTHYMYNVVLFYRSIRFSQSAESIVKHKNLYAPLRFWCDHHKLIHIIYLSLNFYDSIFRGYANSNPRQSKEKFNLLLLCAVLNIKSQIKGDGPWHKNRRSSYLAQNIFSTMQRAGCQRHQQDFISSLRKVDFISLLLLKTVLSTPTLYSFCQLSIDGTYNYSVSSLPQFRH